MPNDIDDMTLEQLAILIDAGDDSDPDVIDGNAALLNPNEDVARAFARQEGFIVAPDR